MTDHQIISCSRCGKRMEFIGAHKVPDNFCGCPPVVQIAPSPLGRSCMMCKRFHITFGCPDYSEVTPGEIGEVTCALGKQSPLTEEGGDRFREWVRFGNTCPSFEGAEEVAE